ncbi:FAD-dependent oxidoreductase [Streptomyces sp. NPDC047928]|uniref:FAD-dependent oxidoreductase n=1 Tax=unclassified Streptomyces TaxID=2593676 RepID=UPI003718BDA6
MGHRRGRAAGTGPVAGTAIVVGASMAGLCAARVLAERFGDVVVIDRDALSDGAGWRHQVPQGRHAHLLLYAGGQLLEEWFPGISEQLVAGGATDVDVCRDLYWHQAGGVLRRPASRLRGPAMSRPYLEATVRDRVADLPNVVIRDRTAVTGVEADAAHGRITGVRLADGSAAGCDLLVDSTGRQARSLEWLKPLGYDAPPTSVVGVDTRYASRTYRRTEQPVRDWKAAGVVGAPATRRMAIALPLEGDRWIVTLAGLNGETPPADEEGRLRFARSLEDPVIAEVMAVSEPLGEPVSYRFPANLRRHVERLRRFPLGWITIGDAVASFDPVYGQGMTSAAQQAAALGACLDLHGTLDRAFSRRFFRAAAHTVNVPWSLAVGGDFAYADTTGRKPPGTDLLNRYVERVTVAAQHDDDVLIRFNEVAGLARRPESLLAPGFAVRALRTARRGPVGPATARAAGTRADAGE